MRHRGCFVDIYFSNPLDGFRPSAPDGAPLFRQNGFGLGCLTLLGIIDAGTCGQFEIVQGGLIFRTE
jgi:hypothetical protein